MERKISTLNLLCMVFSAVGALNVNIPQDLYEFARGDNITLPCTFQTKSANPSLVIISWSAEAENTKPEETLILTYYSTGELDINSLYETRVSLDVDIAKGKADLKLSSIALADNKVFECRVQIPGDDEGKLADMARLVVLVAPSPPICKIQGKAEYGQNISLTCVSEEGLPPPTYKWQIWGVGNISYVTDPGTTDVGGVLSLYNISEDASGSYICTSSNKISSATCNITFSVVLPSKNKSGLLHGSTVEITGLLVTALITLFFVTVKTM
uniref:cell surface A33 antigen-like n=1 Tax=Scatophagus argus TaxID=75038 RepID=UPI001ED8505B|nr:cell surface A33 antigen-like [Scatophagus argus]